MSRVPRWLGRLGAGLSEMSERLDERRAEVERETAGDDTPGPSRQAAAQAPPPPDHAAESPPPPPVVRPDPVQAVPWSVRVAAEAGWRLLVLAGTVWVLMRVISAVQLVVFAFVVALLITALLQPTVARLKRHGVPRGPATALTAILGFVVMGLIGWFVTWQVMENIDNLSNQIQSGIKEVQQWLTLALGASVGLWLAYRYYKGRQRAGLPVGPPVLFGDEPPLPPDDLESHPGKTTGESHQVELDSLVESKACPDSGTSSSSSVRDRARQPEDTTPPPSRPRRSRTIDHGPIDLPSQHSQAQIPS